MPTVKDIIVRKPTEAEKTTCKTWPVWNCGPSTFKWEYTEKETCLILQGRATITDGTSSVSFGPGDLVIFPDGLECTWTITEAVSKHYNFG